MATEPFSFTKTDYRKALKPYATAIGELVFAWNWLHEHLSELFEHTIQSPSRKMGTGIWYSTDSDFAQRKMLRSAVERSKRFTQPQRDDILWVINRIEESLRHHRNDAMHAPVTFLFGAPTGPLSMIADVTSDSPRAQSLWKNTRDELNLRKFLKEQTTLADRLGRYVHAINRFILAPAVHAWPDKPKLPHAHRTTSRKGSSRQSSAKSPQRQPESYWEWVDRARHRQDPKKEG